MSEVARRWKVSSSTVYLLVEHGLLECHRIGVGRGTLRFTEEQLKSYLQAAKAGTERPAFTPLRGIKHVSRMPS